MSGPDNDIAILRLSKDIVFGKNVQKINLPEDDVNTFDDATVILTGWGALRVSLVSRKQVKIKKTSRFDTSTHKLLFYQNRLNLYMNIHNIYKATGFFRHIILDWR